MIGNFLSQFNSYLYSKYLSLQPQINVSLTPYQIIFFSQQKEAEIKMQRKSDPRVTLFGPILMDTSAIQHLHLRFRVGGIIVEQRTKRSQRPGNQDTCGQKVFPRHDWGSVPMKSHQCGGPNKNSTMAIPVVMPLWMVEISHLFLDEDSHIEIVF